MSWDAVRLPPACQCCRVRSRRNLPSLNRRRPKISASTPCKACGCGKRAELDAGAGVCSKAIRLGAVCRGECVARGDVNTTQQHSAGTLDVKEGAVMPAMTTSNLEGTVAGAMQRTLFALVAIGRCLWEKTRARRSTVGVFFRCAHTPPASRLVDTSLQGHQEPLSESSQLHHKQYEAPRGCYAFQTDWHASKSFCVRFCCTANRLCPYPKLRHFACCCYCLHRPDIVNTSTALGAPWTLEPRPLRVAATSTGRAPLSHHSPLARPNWSNLRAQCEKGALSDAVPRRVRWSRRAAADNMQATNRLSSPHYDCPPSKTWLALPIVCYRLCTALALGDGHLQRVWWAMPITNRRGNILS